MKHTFANDIEQLIDAFIKHEISFDELVTALRAVLFMFGALGFIAGAALVGILSYATR